MIIFYIIKNFIAKKKLKKRLKIRLEYSGSETNFYKLDFLK
jgi:hypothetical protein